MPGAALASIALNEADLIDYREDVPNRRAASVWIVTLMEAEGRRRSIHVNGWFGAWNKLTTTQRLFAQVFGTDLERERERERYVFAGDSPNDAPMFAYFPHAVGVANVAAFAGRLAAEPAYVTQAASGAGFCELADFLLDNSRRPTPAVPASAPPRSQRSCGSLQGTASRVDDYTLLRLIVRIPHLDVGNRTRNTPCAAVGTHFREACGLPVFQIPGPPVRFVAAAAALLIAYSCSAATMSAEDTRFAAFVETVLDGYWRLSPEEAFAVGYYRR